MRKWLSLVIPIYCFAGRAFAKAQPQAAPDAKEIVSIVMKHLNTPLPKEENSGCKLTTLPKNPKVKDYLEFLMATLAEAPKDERQQTEAACIQKSDIWECSLTCSIINAAGDPWRYGLRFHLDKNKRLVPKTMTCPGAP